MTSSRIKEIALVHFAQKGYEGAALSQIADEVGIKKPSIYAHFKGKDDLFLAIIQDVVQAELMYVNNYLTKEKIESLHDYLFRFLENYLERYENDNGTKFFLRISFFPPEHLHDQIMTLLYDYLDEFERLLIPIFTKALEDKTIGPIDPNDAAIAFIGLLDSVLVEMLYGGPDRYAKRFEAAWKIFWRGLSRE